MCRPNIRNAEKRYSAIITFFTGAIVAFEYTTNIQNAVSKLKRFHYIIIS